MKKEERQQFFNKVEKLQFTTRGAAQKQTGLSYLLGFNSSSKIAKGKKINYYTGVLYLAPSISSGYNVCPMATNGCVNACLNESGRAKIELLSKGKNRIKEARIKKTWLFYANRQFFTDWLHAEIEAGKQMAEKTAQNYAVRLNGTSDLDISLFKVLENFSNVQFYDYTKVFKRLKKFANNKNYHLTFSYSENNQAEVLEALRLKFNVAIPFAGKVLPMQYNGVKVYDADETDVRPTDEAKGQFAGLRVKSIASKSKMLKAIKAGFIVQPN
jgi:hypothetical protein